MVSKDSEVVLVMLAGRLFHSVGDCCTFAKSLKKFVIDRTIVAALSTLLVIILY